MSNCTEQYTTKIDSPTPILKPTETITFQSDILPQVLNKNYFLTNDQKVCPITFELWTNDGTYQSIIYLFPLRQDPTLFNNQIINTSVTRLLYNEQVGV